MKKNIFLACRWGFCLLFLTYSYTHLLAAQTTTVASGIKTGPVDAKIFSAPELVRLDKGEEVIKDVLLEKVVPTKIFPLLEVRNLYVIDFYKRENGVITYSRPTNLYISEKQLDIGGTVAAIYLPYLLLMILGFFYLKGQDIDVAMTSFSGYTAMALAITMIICSWLPLTWAIITGMVLMSSAGLYFGNRIKRVWGGFFGLLTGFLVGMYGGTYAGVAGLMEHRFSDESFFNVWGYLVWYLISCLIITLTMAMILYVKKIWALEETNTEESIALAGGTQLHREPYLENLDNTVNSGSFVQDSGGVKKKRK